MKTRTAAAGEVLNAHLPGAIFRSALPRSDVPERLREPMIRPYVVLALVLSSAGAVACEGAPEGGASTPGSAPADAAAAAPFAAADADAPATPTLPNLPTARVEGLEVRDLAAAEPVTGERSALFLTVVDASGAGDALLSVEVEGAGHASLHATEHRDGVMAMRPVDSVPVPAGGRAELRPGGFHGMIEGITAPWAAGDTVRVLLRFRRGGDVRAPALVVPYGELDRRFPREPSAGHGAGS